MWDLISNKIPVICTRMNSVCFFILQNKVNICLYKGKSTHLYNGFRLLCHGKQDHKQFIPFCLALFLLADFFLCWNGTRLMHKFASLSTYIYTRIKLYSKFTFNNKHEN